MQNKFLQIDLISLFFLKASLNISKSPNLLQQYLEVFRSFNGKLSKENFLLLPLINNFKNTDEFIQSLKNHKTIELIIEKYFSSTLAIFLNNLKSGKLDISTFKTAKGEVVAFDVINVFKEIFLHYKQREDKNIFLKLLRFKKNEKFYFFKTLYLSHITQRK